MTRQLLTDEQFDHLWQHTEAESLAHRFGREYPVWLRRRRRRAGTAAALAACALLLITVLPLHTAADGYLRVYSNRPDVAENHWADVATAMLMEEVA